MKPQKLKLHSGGAQLDIQFPDREPALLSAEFLRVFSPSAEVKGHGPGQEVLQFGKINVKITGIERSGNYAVRLNFDDGHDTGIYSWDYLLELSDNKKALWEDYEARLQAAGRTRDPETQLVKFFP